MEVLSSLNFRRSAGAEATFVVVDGVSSMDSDDEDSFIDLVFASPKCKEKAEYISKRVNEEICSNKSFESDSEARFGFVDSPRDVFSGAKVYPVETNLKAPSPISVLKSPTRLKVFALGLRKSKSVKTASTASTGASALSLGDQFRKSLSDEESKRFPAKYVVGDAPAADSFTRNNTLRCKIQQERVKDASPFDLRKRLPKYLKLIKPLYMKVKTLSSKTAAPVKPGNIPAGHRVFCNHLGKSKSTSAASRRDDSLLQQHDGIQSAILHCKRSYNSASSDCSVLARSASDPSCEKSIDPP